jgi:4-alpha-glucanotransferase
MSKPVINLILGIHNHQPLGNFQSIMESAYDHAYKPFLDVLDEFPKIKMSIHNTGILYDWFEKHRPEYIEKLEKMVSRRQVEILTGGYFEPILPVIPEEHQLGQINRLTNRIRRLFGTEATTLWLAERVWEPHLPGVLDRAQVSAVIMDDTHFRSSGLSDEQLYGYYLTEELGHAISAFPINKKLRYLIPFRTPEETIEYLRSLATPSGERVLVMADDGEKFGVWPETYESVYGEQWLHRFFTCLMENRSWIKTTTFKDFQIKQRALGNIYLPAASYSEMMTWALPALASRKLDKLKHEDADADYQVFLRGGFWRNFFAKYPESNDMHKKMLWLSRRVSGLPVAGQRKILDWIWRAQCNCVYWHGVFGGLYLNHLRVETYRNLLQAEAEMDTQENGPADGIEVEKTPIHGTGDEVLLVRSKDLSLGINLSQGGHIYELSDKSLCFNMLNTMTRREEAYHDVLRNMAPVGENAEGGSIHDVVRVKEEGLADLLQYDWYRRVAWIDHFLPIESTLEDWTGGECRELGDFVNWPYTCKMRSSKSGPFSLSLTRNGNLWFPEKAASIRVVKTLGMATEGGEIKIAYTITNTSARDVDVLFGSEWGFALQAGDTFDRYYRIEGTDLGENNQLGSVGESRQVQRFSLHEDYVGLSISFSLREPATLWRHPLYSVSSSEGGFERSFQSCVVMPVWRVSLSPGEKKKLKIVLTIGRTKE